MTPDRAPKDLAASVRARLLALAETRGVEFQLLLSEFAVERLLYRLGESRHAEQFVLKGATLFRLWADVGHRATWDLDLHGRGKNDMAAVLAVIGELCSMDGQDGVLFDARTLRAEAIQAEEEYEGVRVRLEAMLAGARIPVQIDIGFGDVVVPAATIETFPVLLAHPAPRILVYPKEVVIAEKLEAMISLGETNGRMKDFFDVFVLAKRFEFEGRVLTGSIRATFERRGAPLPESVPRVLTEAFLSSPERRVLWRALIRRGRLDAPPEANELAPALQSFLWPPLEAIALGKDFSARWRPGGLWMTSTETA